MPLHVTTYSFDPLKGGNQRDKWDTNLRQAMFTLKVTGTLAGLTMSIQSPVPGVAAVTVNEGADWANVVGDLRQTLINLTGAIKKKTLGMLQALTAMRVPAAGQSELDMTAPSVGTWGHGITITTGGGTAANLSINGAAGPAVAAPGVGGGGGDEVAKFQTFLNALAGSPVYPNLQVIPTNPQGSTYLIIWNGP